MRLNAYISRPPVSPHSERQTTAAATRPASESAPVSQRLSARRAKASTSMTTTPATETMVSGMISVMFTSGEAGASVWSARQKFIVLVRAKDSSVLITAKCPSPSSVPSISRL